MTLTDIDQPRAGFVNAAIAGVAARCAAIVAELRHRRKVVSALGGLSPRQLRDIGLIRNDVAAACSEPLSRNAGAELARIANARSRNW